MGAVPKPPFAGSNSVPNVSTAWSSTSASTGSSPAGTTAPRRCSRMLPATRCTSSGWEVHTWLSACSTWRNAGCPCRGWSGK